METNYEPELGQLFGQPHQELSCPEYVYKTLDALRAHFSLSNGVLNTPFDNSGERFKNDTFEANAYDWSECMCEDEDAPCSCGHVPQAYNFKWRNFEVSWYKYLGRGMSMNRKTSKEECLEMYKECAKSLF